MSISLTTQMFSRLSATAQEEVLSSFCNPLMDDIDYSPVSISLRDSYVPMWKPSSTTPIVNTAFDSASLSFSQPLNLPSSSEPFELKKKVIRYAKPTSIATQHDIYTVKSKDDIEEIISDIDSGYFIGPPSWTRGQKHHPENWDVRRVLHILTYSGPQNSYSINMKLLTICRTRISAVLRQLKIQGIVTVKSAI